MSMQKKYHGVGHQKQKRTAEVLSPHQSCLISQWNACYMIEVLRLQESPESEVLAAAGQQGHDRATNSQVMYNDVTEEAPIHVFQFFLI
jgi:hypothetical protein